MHIQPYLNDLFAAANVPIGCFNPDGSERSVLLPARFSSKEDFLQSMSAQAKSFVRNIGDPLFVNSADSVGGIRLPDFAVVLIGPTKLPGRKARSDSLVTQQIKTVNLWLKLMADLMVQEVLPSDSAQEVDALLQDLIPPELAAQTQNQLLSGPHNQYRHEAGIVAAIRSGDVVRLQHAFAVPLGGEIGILSPDHLRSIQNHANLMNVLASRAAIAEGIPSEEAFSLSDKFFFAVENCKNAEECWQLRETIARAFTLQIRRYKEKLAAGEHPLVKKARELIYLRLFAKIRISDLAAELNCSADYLETLFKAAHGLTLRQYLIKARLNAAKELLRMSKCSVADIAALLHFSSSSHLCSAFVKQEGFTPLQYRKLKCGSGEVPAKEPRPD